MTSEIKYSIIRKKIKNLRITVKNSGDVIVSAPWFYLKGQIDKIVEMKRDWIEKRIKSFAESKNDLTFDDSKIRYLGEDFEFILDKTRKEDFIDFENNFIYSKKDLLTPDNIIKWHKQKAKEYLSLKTEEIAKLHSFKIGKITVRTQKTRWGSCSAKNDISLNSALIKCPIKIIEYVIYHELSHTIQKNHSKKFWDLLGMHFPDYLESRKWLRKNGNQFIVS